MVNKFLREKKKLKQYSGSVKAMAKIDTKDK